MYLVRVEHDALDYDRWKAAFDADPVGRRKAGVRRYRVSRARDDAGYVAIDLELDTADEAADMVDALHRLWQRVEGDLVAGPRARVYEVVESAEV